MLIVDSFFAYNVVMVRIEQVLESWRAVRRDVAAAVEEFPEQDGDFRPVPELQSFREIARHILNAGDGLIGALLEGEADFQNPEGRERRKAFWRNLPADAAGPELAASLRQSVEERTTQLAAQPAAFFAEMVKRVDGQMVTRLEMVQFVKEHELTHRQQLFTYQRLKGMVPVTTRRRLALQAAK